MGKLYDKQDLEYDLAQIDQCEQEISKQILAGTFPAFRSKQAVDLCEAERQRAKMRLLRTSQLVSDLRVALALFNSCKSCQLVAGKQRPCIAHKAMLFKAKRAIHFAAEDNLGRRAAAGIIRDEDEQHDGSLNEWESWYFADRRMGIWPGDAHYARQQYGSLDYRGWLRMLLEEEEITFPAYESEMKRLRGVEPASGATKLKKDRPEVANIGVRGDSR